MSKCKYLIDISPYDPLCDHPCRLYGGGAVDAECETCQYRMEDLEAENTKLREPVADMWEYIYIGTAQDGQSLHDRTRKLGIEVGK